MRGIVGVAVIAIASSGLAQAQTKCDLQSKPDTLTRCIEELQKEIERSRLEIQELKTANSLIKKQLCMIAIEQHRTNSRSEALKRIIENVCAQFKKPPASES
jgi:SMC interacting uncharacterized protein involved in chromosome segregation